MSISILQAPTPATAIGGSTLSKSFASACTPGSIIVALVTAEIGISFCADDHNTGVYATPSGTGGVAASFYMVNTSSAAVTVTAVFSSSAPGCSLSIFEIGATAGTPELDASAAIAYQADSPPNTNRTLTLTTTVANALGIAAAIVYPSNYISNPDSGWTTKLAPTAGTSQYHSSEYRADLGVAGAKTVWAGQGVDYATYIGMVALAFREPTALTKKWSIPIDTNGVTVQAEIFAGTIGAATLIDQASGLVSASGIVKFNVASPGSFSVGDKRRANVHNYSYSTSTTNIFSFAGIATVIEE